MKKTALVTIGSLLAVVGLVATATTQTGCKLTITDCGDAATCGFTTDGGDGGGGGGGDSGGDGGSTCTGMNNVTFDTNATCDPCMESNCCSQVTDCFGNTSSECAIVYKCLADCNDNQKCEDDCKTQVSAEGTTKLNAVVQCLQTSCSTQCPAPPG